MAADADVPVPAPGMTSERYGPLVHRSVRHGAYLYIAGVVIFVAAMIITQIGYTGTSYSLRFNYISDLGAAHCGLYHSGLYVCSPWHDVFAVGIVLMGLLLIFGTILIRTAFPARGSRTIGLALLILSGAGAIGVGLFPEDVNLTAHTASAGVGFILGNLALIVLAFAMFRDTRWDGYRTYTLVSGLVGMVAFFLFYFKLYGPLGVGGMERLIVAPLLVWALIVGIHLARIPTYAPPRARAVKA